MGNASTTLKKSQNQEACDSAFGSVWLNGGTEIFKLSRTRHAFSLIAMSCQDKDHRLRFWFPAYFTNSVIKPLRQTGIEIVFYPVGHDMIPDWSACERLAAESPPDLFTLVHYFGWSNAIDRARSFCDQTGAKLIEDAAHLLGPAGRIGSLADFVCYSPRKFFRIPDGGLLVVRDPSHAKKIQKLIGGMQRTSGRFRSQVGRIKRGLKRLLRPDTGSPMPSLDRSKSVFMSRIAERALEDIVRRRLAGIVVRHSRFESWVREIVKDVHRVEVIDKTDRATRWIGLRCEDEAAARSILDRLRKDGILAVNWPLQLPPDVDLQGGLDEALRLRSTTILVIRPIRSRRRANDLPGPAHHAQTPG